MSSKGLTIASGLSFLVLLGMLIAISARSAPPSHALELSLAAVAVALLGLAAAITLHRWNVDGGEGPGR